VAIVAGDGDPWDAKPDYDRPNNTRSEKFATQVKTDEFLSLSEKIQQSAKNLLNVLT